MHHGGYEHGVLQIAARIRTDSHGFLQIASFSCMHHGGYKHGVLQTAAQTRTDSHGFLQIIQCSCMHHGCYEHGVLQIAARMRTDSHGFPTGAPRIPTDSCFCGTVSTDLFRASGNYKALTRTLKHGFLPPEISSRCINTTLHYQALYGGKGGLWTAAAHMGQD